MHSILVIKNNASTSQNVTFGVMGGLKNTFAKAGTAGKAGMIGAGIVGAGLLAKGASSMFGGKKD